MFHHLREDYGKLVLRHFTRHTVLTCFTETFDVITLHFTAKPLLQNFMAVFKFNISKQSFMQKKFIAHEIILLFLHILLLGPISWSFEVGIIWTPLRVDLYYFVIYLCMVHNYKLLYQCHFLDIGTSENMFCCVFFYRNHILQNNYCSHSILSKSHCIQTQLLPHLKQIVLHVKFPDWSTWLCST